MRVWGTMRHCTLRRVAGPRPRGQKTQDTADSKEESPDLLSCRVAPPRHWKADSHLTPQPQGR